MSETYLNKAGLDTLAAEIKEKFQKKISSDNTIPSDSVVDTNNAHKFVTADEKAQITTNKNNIATIEAKIPAQASETNQLADKDFVNSSIATATATFRGTYNLINDLKLTISATHEQVATALKSKITTADNEDYSYVQIPTATSTPATIASVDRYKYNGTAWAYEYTLNNSGFTATQWAAINSGITETKVNNIVEKSRTIATLKLDADITKTQLLNALNIADGAEVNVQSNWSQTDTAADDYIKNKPDLEGTYMTQVNPTGTGSFSLNRRPRTTVGHCSFAEGGYTEASGYYSHAEGSSTEASGYYSHAEGSSTVASGSASHAEGSSTLASGSASHAEGDYTKASGYASHAEGTGTIASGDSQHVFGKYNIPDTDDTYVEIVGRGGDSDTSRSNARTLDWSGNEWLAGKITPAGGFSDGNNGDYVLKLPDTTLWTADKTIATTDEVITTSKSAASGGTDLSLVTTGEKYTWNSKQSTITGGASTITSSNLTTNMALISDSSGKVAAHSSISSTELGYLDGATSNIQTQINNKVTMSDYITQSYIESLFD